MALMADFAASGVREHRGPSPWVAALLTVLTPGLGHLYIGQARRGITLFVLILIADTLLMFAMMGVLARFWMFAISFMRERGYYGLRENLRMAFSQAIYAGMVQFYVAKYLYLGVDGDAERAASEPPRPASAADGDR